MTALFSRIPIRESRVFIVASAAVFVLLLGFLLAWPRPVKVEKKIADRQEEQRAGSNKVVPTDWYVTVWLRRGWMINTGIAGALLLASPWLGRRRKAGMGFLDTPVSKPMTRAGWLFLAALITFAAWQNYPRLFLSMWGDEEFNASRFIVDEVSRDDVGAIKITPRPWSATLWSFRKTTNHLGFTALARLSHDAFFVKKTGPGDPFFSEALIRLPVFIAGLLFIPAMFWCGRVWGISGGLAAMIAVLHPWFVRFGVDGRAYGLVILGVPVMLGLLGRGLQTAHWRWWWLLGFAEFFVFWCYFGSVYLLVALNVAALGLIFTATKDKQSRCLLFSRWFVSGVFATMLVIGMMSPCWPQLFEFLEQKPITGALDWPWWRDSFSEMFFGSPWVSQNVEGALELAVSKNTPTILRMAAVFAAALLFVVGSFKLARNKTRRWLLVIVLGAPALMLVHMTLTGVRPYAWYLLPYLPGLLLMFSSCFLVRKDRKDAAWMRPTSCAIFVVLIIQPMRPARFIYAKQPIERSRESVALYRTVTNPRNADIDKDVISGGFVMFTEGYDPAMHRFKDVAGLRELMAEAEKSGKQFYVNVGHIEFARDFGYKDICQIIEDPAHFEHVGHLPGLFFSTTRDVFRYRGR